MEIDLKFGFWLCLPWKLCGLAHDDLELARESGRICLLLWDAGSGGAGLQHPQSRRFLEPTWQGLELGLKLWPDPALRDDLIQFVSGASMQQLGHVVLKMSYAYNFCFLCYGRPPVFPDVGGDTMRC
jgi:hypothetical protein